MKKFSFYLLLLTISLAAFAQQEGITGGPLGAASTPGAGWPGTYQGSISGTASVLTVSLSGSQLIGKIDASGYIYNLTGIVDAASCKGQLLDKNTGGSMEFNAQLSGNTLDLVLMVPNQYGQLNEWPLQFVRGEGSQAQSGNVNTGAYGSEQPQAGTGSEQRDPNLVGGWRHTETYTSGEFGTVSEWYMNIYRDGSYTYGDGQIAGGSNDYSFYSGEGSGHETGKWKTENDLIYINEGYGWQAYARYYIEGNSMLFTFGDGSKQLWERYR